MLCVTLDNEPSFTSDNGLPPGGVSTTTSVIGPQGVDSGGADTAEVTEDRSTIASLRAISFRYAPLTRYILSRRPPLS